MQTITTKQTRWSLLPHRIVGALVLAILILLPQTALSVTAHASEASSQYVYDKAELLTTDQIASLESTMAELQTRTEVTTYILTDTSSNGMSRRDYMEAFFDQQSAKDSALIFVNMESGNRGVEIQGYGTAEFTINGSRIEYILDEVTPYLKDGAYYDAFTTFLSKVDYYVNKDPDTDTTTHAPDTDYPESDKYYTPDENYNQQTGAKDILGNLWVQLAISLLIGGGAVAGMAFNMGGRMTVNGQTYLDASHSKVVASHDQYLRTTTTRVRKPKANSGGGGGGFGGGISPGGSSHSGGGRSF